ncbi:MAG TPA: hypothetical protein VIN37_02520 [Candidatus Limnocylindria bacterium]
MALGLLAVGSVLVVLAYGLTHAATGASTTWANELAYLAFMLAFSTVGALVAAKRPGNPIGWLLLGSVLCYAIGGAGVTVAGPPLIAWAGAWAWGVGVGLAVVTLLLFPDGHLPSRRWRPVLWVAVVGIVAFVVGAGFGAPTIGDSDVPNPFAVQGSLGEALGALQEAFPLVIVAALLALVSVVARFRRSRGIEREQIKWVLYAAALVGVGLVAQLPIFIVMPPDDAANASNAVATSAFACVPVAIGIAVLRYRLYDIDVLIRRTLVYGATTGAIALAFFGGIVLLQAVLRPVTSGSELAVAISTLVSFALFQPLRGRVQRAVDRRFYRAKYDAEHTVDAFAARLRGDVDLDSLRVELLDAVADTLQPAHASVWIR